MALRGGRAIALRGGRAMALRGGPGRAEGQTLLHRASVLCSIAILRNLVAFWPDGVQVWETLTDRWPAVVLHVTNNAGNTPQRLCMQSELVEAVRRNNASRVERLSAGQFDVSSTRTVDEFSPAKGQTLLHEASACCSFDVLRLLVEAWPDGVQAWPEGVSAQDVHGDTPLHYASRECHVNSEVWEMLTDRWPAVVLATNNAGDTPLQICMHSELAEAVYRNNASRAAELLSGVQVVSKWLTLMDEYLCMYGPKDYEPEMSMVGACRPARHHNNKGDTPLHAVPFRTGFWDYDLLQVLKQVWPDGSMPTVHRLQCELVVAAACNVTAPWFQPSWQAHAVDFNCLSFRQLSKPAVQLWLSCGGYVGWRSPSGVPLWADLDSPDARDFLKAQVSTTTLISAISAATWVVPGCVVLVTCAVVALEQKLLQRKRQRASLHSTAKRLDPFQNGAMLLVSRAFSTHGTLWRLWCWLEVYTAIYLFGFALIVAYWAWWLPVVTLAYFIPAVRLRGLRALLRAPALAILSRGFPSQVIALLRTSVLMGIVHFLTAIAKQGQAIHGRIINPFHAELRFHRLGGGHWAPWLGDYQVWGLWDNSFFGPISAAELFMCLHFFSLVVVLSYVVWLALLVVMGCTEPLRAGRGDPEPEDLQEAALQAVKDLLEQSPEQFVEVHSKIKPVVALAWPWQGGGLWMSVAVLMLDVGLDINTVGTFLLSRDYFFAALLTFIVVRSTLKQLCVLPLWRLRQAVTASAKRGIPRQDILDFLEEI
ncbi:RIPK4 [Symbiodinium sp. CCMP2592]|nr:RIPK4 [Symbiodinium sp. CCMP2592]